MARKNARVHNNYRAWMIAGAAALVIALIGVGAWGMHSSPPAQATTRITLDPKLFDGKARAAYQVAARDPALLAQLHCYCGCDKELGHRNLLDCYRNKHAAVCPICIGEAIEAERLAKEGLPVTQIRRALSDDYGHGG